MCWFLTVALTADAGRLLPPPARAPELRAEPQENASINGALAEVARLPKNLKLWTITRNGCSCDLIRSKETQPAATNGADEYAVRDDVRALLAGIVEQTGKPLAFVIHTYSGAIDEAFTVVKGPRLTPDELRAVDRYVPADAICVVREIPTFT